MAKKSMKAAPGTNTTGNVRSTMNTPFNKVKSAAKRPMAKRAGRSR